LLVGLVPYKSRAPADPTKPHGREEVIAWAHEREGGGRAFCFTGVDLHKNWELEEQRKLVVNGILWAAKLEVPKEGAKVEVNAADLTRHVRAPEKPKTHSPSNSK
jgi:hypothetical protein